MRDFRDSKIMAQTLRATLAAKGHKISVADSLELVAKAFGVADWNTLAAAIKTAAAYPDEPEPADKPFDNNRALDNLARLLGVDDWEKLRAVVQAARPPEAATKAAETAFPAEPGSGPTRRQHFCAELEATLHRAVQLTAIRKHGYNTLEHLLLALIDDADAAEVMRACGADLPKLSESVTSYIDGELQSLVRGRRSALRHANGWLPPCDPACGDPRAVCGPQPSHRRQRASGDLLRARKPGRPSPAAAGHGPLRCGQLHRQRRSQGRQGGLMTGYFSVAR